MLKKLINLFKEKEPAIGSWILRKQSIVGCEPLYASVDLRNAGFKVAQVDTNLFPAGWNNLCPNYTKKSTQYFKDYFDKYFPSIKGPKELLIIPEDHTRNLYYFSNINRLKIILENAGFRVKIGSLNPEIKSRTAFYTNENEEIVLEPIERKDNRLVVEGLADFEVIVNNDFSNGVPAILKNLDHNLLPMPEIGWHYRRKSENFRIYNELMGDFARMIGTDSWNFVTRFTVVDNFDFDNVASREVVAMAVDELLNLIAKDYKERGIDMKPSVFIKNNAGTYGMGVIRVDSANEVRNLNVKQRKQMRVGKSGAEIRSLILQEGVVTVDRIKNAASEPVMYLVNNKPVGGFYRYNEEKGELDNLNSKGMQFSKLCFHEEEGYYNKFDPELTFKDLEYLYGVIATVASIAAGFEIKDLKQCAP